MANDVVVDGGLEEILKRMLGLAAASPLYIAVGSGNASPSGTETSLGTETGRSLCSSVTVVGNVATLKAFFSTAQANGNIGESALFTAGAGGTMIDKGVESPVKVKTAAQEMVVQKVITIERVE